MTSANDDAQQGQQQAQQRAYDADQEHTQALQQAYDEAVQAQQQALQQDQRVQEALENLEALGGHLVQTLQPSQSDITEPSINQSQELEGRAFRLFYEHGQFSLQEQRQRNAIIEGKANWVLGFSATLIGIMGLLLPEAAPWSRYIAIVAGAFFLGTVYLIFASLRVRNFETAPTPAQLSQLMEQHGEDALREWTAIAISNTHETNDAILIKKASGLKWAMYFFIAEAILVATIAMSVAFKAEAILVA